jgi:transcriptional regulator with XRE-family HTH domain
MKSLHDRAYELLVACLKDARVQQGVTQVELAARIGADQSYVSKYERCERRLDYVELRAICLALGIDPVRFIKSFEDVLRKEEDRR